MEEFNGVQLDDGRPKAIYFKLEIVGYGNTKEEAWQDALQGMEDNPWFTRQDAEVSEAIYTDEGEYGTAQDG